MTGIDHSSNGTEQWEELAKRLEMVSTDLESGNVEAAGAELRHAANWIRREVATDTDRSGGEPDGE